MSHDLPGIDLKDNFTYQWSGLDVSVAEYVMKALNVAYGSPDSRITDITADQRESRALNSPDGLVLGAFSITDARIREGITFTTPYLYSYQDVLVRNADAGTVTSVADLHGKRVCTGSKGTTPYEHMLELNQGALGGPPLDAILDPQPSEDACIRQLDSRNDDAFVSDSAVLYGFQIRHPELHQVNIKVWPRPEQYGIGFRAQSPEDKAELDTIIWKMISDGTWRQAIISNFCPDLKRADPPCPIADVFINNPPPSH
jgi:glutamate transport system substrate-binding protein